MFTSNFSEQISRVIPKNCPVPAKYKSIEKVKEHIYHIS